VPFAIFALKNSCRENYSCSRNVIVAPVIAPTAAHNVQRQTLHLGDGGANEKAIPTITQAIKKPTPFAIGCGSQCSTTAPAGIDPAPPRKQGNNMGSHPFDSVAWAFISIPPCVIRVLRGPEEELARNPGLH
jgi:hypothetical protein